MSDLTDLGSFLVQNAGGAALGGAGTSTAAGAIGAAWFSSATEGALPVPCGSDGAIRVGLFARDCVAAPRVPFHGPVSSALEAGAVVGLGVLLLLVVLGCVLCCLGAQAER